MRKFRLEWARQQGERKAKEFGFDDFPIDPFAIAEKEEILIEPKPADAPGVSGGIIFLNTGTGIFYATNIDNCGFQRFTVGHELGHYFLDGHPEEIQKSGSWHISRAGFREGDNSIELEADHFASGLLLPSRLVSNFLGNQTIGLEGIKALSDKAKCSLTATAIRAAECSPYPVAVVVSQGKQVCYAFLSDGFKKLGRLSFLRKGSMLPDTVTKKFNSNPENVRYAASDCDVTTLADWFDGPASVELDEEVIGLGSYDLTMTVLSSDDLPEDPDELEDDEDLSLEASWTPKFAYGR
ncbi:ImmA/IrrE family metallo-endopeptidase [Euryhalocaulis caribicus]|uniref:ImmA/IrrE family metallo-endopeptidase n=1 Tax=Euryhalocaulis caribicus TaxID=1161401 RepID=UPI0005251F56|nr:ImmA/IrrE family metallo-endopeptidase [Euryhalocaulis caribicus]